MVISDQWCSSLYLIVTKLLPPSKNIYITPFFGTHCTHTYKPGYIYTYIYTYIPIYMHVYNIYTYILI